MPLCEICKSIPLGNLPPFPANANFVAVPGVSHHQQFTVEQGVEPQLGFRYHEDRGGLWQSAAGGCDLCRLIEHQARLVVSGLGAIEDPTAKALCAVPNFDLWVTAPRRPGDGFWVLSRSGEGERPDNTVVIIAAVGFCVDKDDALSVVFRGRPVDETPGDAAFELVRNWIAESADAERDERQSGSTDLLPPRLVDVGDAATEADTIAIVQPHLGTDRRYAALSYLSLTGEGSDKESRTLQRTPESNTRNATAAGSVVNIDSLPQMFKDAVVLIRNLGLRHLWIDALCIPPPPREDAEDHSSEQEWGLDSDRRAAVYKNAHLSIASTAAADASDGLFARRRKREYVRIPFQGPAAEGTLLAYSLPLRAEVAGLHGHLASESLLGRDARAAARERRLSRRVLHFSADQIFFEGPGVGGHEAGFVSEEGIVGPRWLPLASASHMDGPDGAVH